MRKIKGGKFRAVDCLWMAVLSICLVSMTCCGFGPYFTDDGVRIVHDIKSGEYIGERVGECRVLNKETGKEDVYYKVQLKDGKVMEIAADTVTLSKP